MKVSEARARCRDFSEVRKQDGKLSCKYRLADGMCKHAYHFICELKKDLPPIHVSYSQIRTWESCQRHWAFRYVYKIDAPGGEERWKTVGSAFALIRAKIDAGQAWDIPANVADPIDQARLRAVLSAYATLPRLAASNEEKVSALIDKELNLSVVGYIDGISAGRSTIYEWKYADPSGYDLMSIQMQGGIYLHCIPEAQSLMLAVARKPSRHKPHKAESITDFEKRLSAEILGNLDHWFVFQTYSRSDFGIAEILDLLVTRYREIELVKASSPFASRFLPNYSACSAFGGCEFKTYCQSHVASGIGCKNSSCTHPDICQKLNKASF